MLPLNKKFGAKEQKNIGNLHKLKVNPRNLMVEFYLNQS
jgi:hypothetical protein